MNDRFPSLQVRESEVVLLRGDDREGLLCAVNRMMQQLGDAPELALADVAYTANSQLLPGGQRLGLVAKSLEELNRQLVKAAEKLARADCAHIHDMAGIYYTRRPMGPEGQVAFLFPGEGAQYLGMLGDLPQCFPSVAKVVDECSRLVADHDRNFDLEQLMLSVPDDKELRDAMQQELQKISTTMLSVLSVSWALWELMKTLEIRPDATAGHSAGELAAVWVAGGVQTREYSNLVSAVTAMDAEISSTADAAALLAVGAGREFVAEFLSKANLPTDQDGGAAAFLAMDNCPHQTIVVGLPDAVAELESQLHSNRIICERLAVDRPYHTPLFEPYMQRFREMFSRVTFMAPHTKVYSCTTAEPFPYDAKRVADLVVEHWASRVEFSKMIRRIHKDGVRVFIEVGPKGNLSAFVQDILRGEPCLVVPANVQRHAASTQINHLLAQLAVHHVSFSVAGLYANRSVELVQSLIATEDAATTGEAFPSGPDRIATGERTAAPVAFHDTSMMESDDAPVNVTANAHASAAAAMASAPTADEIPTAVRTRLPSQGQHQGQDVLVSHQQLMQQFLDTQHRVMQRYLSSRRRHIAPALDLSDIAASDVFGNLPTTESQFGGNASARGVGKPSPPAQPRPLVGEVVKHQPQTELITRRRLELAEDLYAGEHTVGGREISRVDPQQYGLPVMPMTFTLETMAENALHLFPGYCVRSIRNVRLHRWLAFYEDDPCTLEVTCHRREETSGTLSDGEILVRVEVTDLGNRDPRPIFAAGLAATGEVVLGWDYRLAPPPAAIQEEVRPCSVTIEQAYANLFHGPLFQELVRLDTIGATTISGNIKVGSRDRVFASRANPEFVLDPVMLDVATHCLAGWHLAMPDQAGRIMLPFELKSIEFFRPGPSQGDEFTVQGRLTRESSRHFEHAVDIVRPDGTLHARFSSARFWRFYLPFHDVNFHGRKDVYYLSRTWPEALTGRSMETEKQSIEDDCPASCVRISPPDDLLQPAMLMVAGHVILSTDEQEDFDKLDFPDAERGKWLFIQTVLKDAVRRFWQDHHGESSFAADIELSSTPNGPWRATRRGATDGPEVPRISVASVMGTNAAIAARSEYVGIGLTTMADESPQHEDRFDPPLGEMAASLAKDPTEGRLRLRAALQAMDQASQHGDFHWEVVGIVLADGSVQVSVSDESSKSDRVVHVRTHREDDLIVATVAW